MRTTVIAVRVLLLALVCTHLRAWSQELPGDIEFLPEQKIFPRFTADALTHTISLSRVTDNRDWIGTIGASVPLLDVATPQGTVQFSVAASTFNRLIKPPRGLTVYTIDYKVDFPLDFRHRDLAFRIAYGHYSCHFADDGIELLGRRSIQYIKDGLAVAASYDFAAIGGYVYTEAQYNYHISPMEDKRWQLQLGFECGNIVLAGDARLYSAVDIKWKQDVSWGTTQSYHLGVKLLERRNHGFRIGYTLRTGFEERGQFFDQQVTANLVSIFVDL